VRFRIIKGPTKPTLILSLMLFWHYFLLQLQLENGGLFAEQMRAVFPFFETTLSIKGAALTFPFLAKAEHNCL